MPTITDWTDLTRFPREIRASVMTVIGRDLDKPILVGSGLFRIADDGSFEFDMIGMAPDLGHSLSWLAKVRQNQYDPELQCRLMFETEDGLHFNGGWIEPHVQPIEGEHPVQMSCRGVSDTLLIGGLPGNASRPSITLRIAIPRSRRSFYAFHHFAGEPQDLDLLGTTIRFEFDSETSILSVTAATSDSLQIPYAENWLAEPFRIMFGELIYPKLVLKDFGNGSATVSLRDYDDGRRLPHWVGLWRRRAYLADKDAFWEMYSHLLLRIATSKGPDGEPCFDANLITRHYEEIIHAASGSRRVWVLTIASTVEALALELFPRKTKDTTADDRAINELAAHIDKWSGDHDLKSAAIRAVKGKADVTVAKGLRQLTRDGRVGTAGVKAWDHVRNRVMHGSLVSIYSDKEEDDRILEMIELVHELTDEILRRTLPTTNLPKTAE
ncbi:hypothetical protein HJB86_26655 [Rhizobium sp. NZLR3b]|uniref:hypothetical protein n=1 Tax=Rhizobium sp. NZLR3b TaxID=2731101 RepID=UPI001C830AF7|nr:hypothetical protein [Rhizobium sp. NZLR3b]MBX5192431.1 hypothetical protein [Rhizobium sp. NZLR3b]